MMMMNIVVVASIYIEKKNERARERERERKRKRKRRRSRERKRKRKNELPCNTFLSLSFSPARSLASILFRLSLAFFSLSPSILCDRVCANARASN
jgi:hypothetical protein